MWAKNRRSNVRLDRTKRTPIEDRMVELLCQDKTNAEIATAVGRATDSVNDALRAIYKAHKVKRRAGMAYLEGTRVAVQRAWVRCGDQLPELDELVNVAFDASPIANVGMLTRVNGIRQWLWQGPQYGKDGAMLCVIAWAKIPPYPGASDER